MLDVRYSTKFKKDFKTCVKRRCKMERLQQVIDILRIPSALPQKNFDHNLSGNYAGYRECHVETDWLLIYRQDGNELLLHRTGTHADLFGM
ncbi:type II toxin-antitoxin system YafQ family toxin [Schaedlerella arabinosiphila]|jgi:mRNA interferase YafQ|uniref:Type II toxin-antitoxin system YafQ family toxin n=1 Tax=Schaedlerella arabinosiphila TaxID=2044587 RepID=A0A9X5CAQ3_9FIRM|nr:type II toxin-antitoxin system YafQ family toxin [Schaedlerella arabinosiphila]KAI4442116.1 mRNA interferase toxin YafQ [Schaedlerella arabinosiphila]MCI9211560.1 type II toxin-antitoxin system YafQ family toxin [Ruminococcus sp.]MCI9632291.1 type II toxin-antitoxin system YafQ family toxin [Ruminococcus sp.]NDO71190.1 type II toxin-antitoxin system YafQ family toxin [Schaedlerella arabinosiphila]